VRQRGQAEIPATHPWRSLCRNTTAEAHTTHTSDKQLFAVVSSCCALHMHLNSPSESATMVERRLHVVVGIVCRPILCRTNCLDISNGANGGEIKKTVAKVCAASFVDISAATWMCDVAVWKFFSYSPRNCLVPVGLWGICRSRPYNNNRNKASL
jgi:hypothetical protein